MFLSHDQETIVAQATPKGSGALAIIRLSGLDAIEIASKISSKSLIHLPSHTIHLANILDDQGNKIDQVMFLIMMGPKSFTGQNVVEITGHNNPFLIEKIIHEVIKNGARLAQEGEFTKRAFLNKKLDLCQAEAINELINAKTELAIKNSLKQLEGSFSYWISEIEQDLLRIFAFSEGSFEFVEEDLNFENEIRGLLDKILKKINLVKQSFDQQEQIRSGIRIALLGAVNAGKSSLFNSILNKERAIVTDIEGTTRDSIEAGIYKNGNFLTFVDTAGLRATDSKIEQEGIKRSLEEALKSDIILLVFDGSKKMNSFEEEFYNSIYKKYESKVIKVINKSDLIKEQKSNFICVSCKDKNNINFLKKEIDRKISSLLEKSNSPFLLNQRQYNLILALEENLMSIQRLTKIHIDYELLSYHLKDSLENLASLSGKTIDQKALDLIFKEFCIGK